MKSFGEKRYATFLRGSFFAAPFRLRSDLETNSVQTPCDGRNLWLHTFSRVARVSQSGDQFTTLCCVAELMPLRQWLNGIIEASFLMMILLTTENVRALVFFLLVVENNCYSLCRSCPSLFGIQSRFDSTVFRYVGGYLNL